MAKAVSFGKPKAAGPTKSSDPADAWVSDRRETAEVPAVEALVPEEPMKRFTIDVPESLHTRVKIGCATRKRKMADVLRDLLEREFPAEDRKAVSS